MRTIKFEYGFSSVNGIVKKVYNLSEIPRIKEKCDVWNTLPIAYVRQFTGLQDKNGVDIYEGDLMKRQNGKIDTVVFDSGTFCVKHENGDFDFIACINSFEVIGNIHQQ